MSDWVRVLDVTDRLRDELIARSVGRVPDKRFDPLVDYILDFSDALEADLPLGRDPGLDPASEGVSGPERDPWAAHEADIEWPGAA